MEIIRHHSNRNFITIQGSPQEIENILDSYRRNIDRLLNESRGIIDPKTYKILVDRKKKITEIQTIIKGIQNGK